MLIKKVTCYQLLLVTEYIDLHVRPTVGLIILLHTIPSTVCQVYNAPLTQQQVMAIEFRTTRPSQLSLGLCFQDQKVRGHIVTKHQSPVLAYKISKRRSVSQTSAILVHFTALAYTCRIAYVNAKHVNCLSSQNN